MTVVDAKLGGGQATEAVDRRKLMQQPAFRQLLAISTAL